jgi:hypothetical protein
MNIEEMVERYIADFEKDRTAAQRYFWREVYDRALNENAPSQRARSVSIAQTVLYGRHQQLQQFPDDPDTREEIEALRIAIEHLRED